MKRKIVLLFATSILITAFNFNTFAQSGQKFSVEGNSLSAGNFLGSTNNQPLLIKVNNALALQINPGGSILINSFSNNGNGIVSFDNTGKLIPVAFPNDATMVFLGNGSWGNVPVPADYWHLHNNDLYTLTSGNVGIGLNNPMFKLDINGDVRISENLYVGGGIIITDKVNAASEVNTGKINATVELKSVALRADSILMDSTKAFYGYSKFAGDVKLENKLDVYGNVNVNGNFKTAGNLTFAGNKTIGYLPASGGNPEITYFTTNPNQNINLCFTPIVQLNQFPGLIQSTGSNNGNTNIMTMGFNGTNCIIDMANTGIISSNDPGLLINNFCGRNVSICTGNNGGNVYLTKVGTTDNVGVGTLTPNAKLDVEGDLRIGTLSESIVSDYILVTNTSGIIGKKPINNLGTQIINDIGNQIITNMSGQIYDDLGNHTATQNIILGNHWLTNNSPINSEGIFINTENNVGINSSTNLTEKFNVLGYGKFFGSKVDESIGYTTIGFDGVHGYLNSSDALLINYYTGQNVVVGGGSPATGDFSTLHSAYLAVNDGSVGIGTMTPTSKLEVNGTIKITDGTQGNGKVLTSDPDGLASWQMPVSSGSAWQLTGNTGIGNFIGTTDPYALIFKTNNTERMRIDENGFVGIGMNNPTSSLFIQGNTKEKSQITINCLSTPVNSLKISSFDRKSTFSGTGDVIISMDSDGDEYNESFKIISNSEIPSTTNTKFMINDYYIDAFARLRINNWNTGDAVTLIDENGYITCRKLIVKISGSIPDFVFDKNYKIPTLYEEEQFYKTNKHLLGIPSAKEVIESGMDVDQFISSLLQKLETSVIQNVEQQKELDNLKEQVNTLQKQVEQLKKF